jgi:hypothetical protein
MNLRRPHDSGSEFHRRFTVREAAPSETLAPTGSWRAVFPRGSRATPIDRDRRLDACSGRHEPNVRFR